MYANSRFAVAVHTLGFVGFADGRHATTSEDIAVSVNTNPVVIRRVLGMLREAGLVTSQPGPGGGWRLNRRPDAITLRDAYRAVEPEPLFALPQRPPSATCDVGRNVHLVLDRYFKDAEAAMEESLANVTLADVMADVARSFGVCRTDVLV